MSFEMWKDFQKEVEDREVYSDSTGFFTYKIQDKELLVNNFFIPQELRGTGLAWKYLFIMNNLAKINNCDILSCIVYKYQKNYNTLKDMYCISGQFKIDVDAETYTTFYKEV